MKHGGEPYMFRKPKNPSGSDLVLTNSYEVFLK